MVRRFWRSISVVFAQPCGAPVVSDVAGSVLTALAEKVRSHGYIATDLVVLDHLRRILGSSSTGDHGRVATFGELAMD